MGRKVSGDDIEQARAHTSLSDVVGIAIALIGASIGWGLPLRPLLAVHFVGGAQAPIPAMMSQGGRGSRGGWLGRSRRTLPAKD